MFRDLGGDCLETLQNRGILRAMRTLALVVVVSICRISAASAEDSPFTVLTNPKATWTYDVVKGKKHKPTNEQVTITVTGVHTAGAYTIIELSPSVPDVPDGAWMIGPEGLREVLYFRTDEVGYTEAHLKDTYDEHYVPRAYLPAKPAKAKKLHWKLLRFGDEDRDYNVTGSITKPDAHTWRTAWKGKYAIPETGEKTPYGWSTDFDPAIGFTQICGETNTCLRLVKP